MMCSIEELGSTRDMYPEAPENGIYIFPDDVEVGADAVEVLGLRDAVFEYEVTSNRVDCFSVIGIAREAAATFGKSFYPPIVPETGNDEDASDYIKVEVRNQELARVIVREWQKISKSARHRNGCREDLLPLVSVRSIIWLILPIM